MGGPVAQDRYCRRLAWETIAARQPAWIFEKVAEQMPEFWKPGSEVLDHLVGRGACGPLAAARLVPIELVLVLPYLALVGLLLVGLARLRFSAPAVLLLLLAAAYNAAHVVAYATTRFRLPVLPVLFVVAAAVIAERSDGSLRPLGGRRLALLLALVLLAAVTLAPGLRRARGVAAARRELSLSRLLAAQRLRRVEARRPARREGAGAERDREQQRGGAAERDGVDAGDADELALERATEGGRERRPDREAGRGERHAPAQHEADHVGPARAERHADADLARALRHALGGHAVDPDRGQQ